MDQSACPRCGSALQEGVNEFHQEREDSGFIMHVDEAYICQNKCGYMEQIECVPEVIAQQGDERLLLLYADEQARILDVKDSVIWPPMHVQSLLSRGYWDDYTGNHDVERLLRNARDSRDAFVEKPNLFQFATSELSQDAFLCWFLSWSLKAYESVDKPLHEAAVHFIAEIFNQHHLAVPIVRTIEITRQFKGLDILAIVNDKYAILIEDKTYTKDHSDQLMRYRTVVEKAYPQLVQLPIYYKIADQSHYRSVEKAKYIPFKRNVMLEILQKGNDNGVDNPIFLDYLNHLQILENKITVFRTKPVTDWDSFAWQGFYQALQMELDGNWGYVSNRKGGFWAFWWKSSYNHDECYYIQLQENSLCVKITEEDGETNTLAYRYLKAEDVLKESSLRGLCLQRPAQLRKGETMTIAIRPSYIQTNVDGTVNLEFTIEELKKY